METARRRATALLSQLDPSLLDESRGPEMSRKKKNGAHVGTAMRCVCLVTHVFFFVVILVVEVSWIAKLSCVITFLLRG